MLFFNNDHQDILLHTIVFQIRDGLAIVESFVVECLSIREKNFFLGEKELFCEKLFIQLDLKLGYLSDHYWKRQILERQEFFPRENRGSQGYIYTYIHK